VPQAGLIGTDLLLQHVLTLDYANGLIHRAAPERFCSDAMLRQAGLQPPPSRGYFGANPARLTCPAAPLRRPCPHIPSIPSPSVSGSKPPPAAPRAHPAVAAGACPPGRRG
jgi:hypothetical protein